MSTDIATTVRLSSCTPPSNSERGHLYVTEASDLGWKPGHWPHGFTVIDMSREQREAEWDSEEEGKVIYKVSGLAETFVVIFND